MPRPTHTRANHTGFCCAIKSKSPSTPGPATGLLAPKTQPRQLRSHCSRPFGRHARPRCPVRGTVLALGGKEGNVLALAVTPVHCPMQQAQTVATRTALPADQRFPNEDSPLTRLSSRLV